MYPTLDVQTTLTFARLHQDGIRASYPRRRRGRTWLLRTDNPPRTRTSPAQTPARARKQHRPAAV